MEMVVVVGIIGALSAIAAPMFNNAIRSFRLSGDARSVSNATAVAKMFFGALDEMATNWMLSRRRYNLESDADTVVDFFLDGARAR